MKKIVPLILALVMVLCMLTACSAGATDSKVIGVVAKGESHAFWQAVKAGATDAAAKYGYTITFRGPASESAKDLPSQMERFRPLCPTMSPVWFWPPSVKATPIC